jgi:hypothetical protein
MFAHARRRRFFDQERSLSNRLRLSRSFRPHLEALEDRALPTVTWVGGNGDWSTPSNWSSGSVPGSSDDVQIKTSVAVTHNALVVDTVRSVTMTAGSLSLNGGGSLRITNGLTLNTTLNVGSPGSFAGNYAILVPLGSQTFSGTGQIVLDGNAGASVSGIYNGTGTLTLAVPVSGRGDFNNSSSMTVVNASTIQANISGGTLTLGGGVQIDQGTYTATNGGTL